VLDQIKALEQIPKNIRSVRTASGEEVPDYPEEALRELVINAVLHRAYDVGNMPSLFYWYSDRVEIRNPGGLFGDLTADKFGLDTSYRNEVLAEAMRGFGYVHKFGTGIPTVHRTLAANGNPPAVFDLVPPGFGVNVYPRKDAA
jgi:ATP-dependent DNA helicase RecG